MSLIQHELYCKHNPDRRTRIGHSSKQSRKNLQEISISKKFHYFYKITNLINRKYYYGIHSTDDLDDGYFGSGVAINNAYKKYGYSNFKKEILAFFDTRDEASAYESKIVNEELLKDPLCYNLVPGGDAGFCWSFKGKHHTEETKKVLSQKNTLPDEQLKQKRRMMYKDGIRKSVRLSDIPEYEKNGWKLGGGGSNCSYKHTMQEYRKETRERKEERLRKEKEKNDAYWKMMQDREDAIVNAILATVDKVDISKFGWMKRMSDMTGYPQYVLRKKMMKRFPGILLKSYKKKTYV